MKKIIILFSLLILTSCASYKIDANYIPDYKKLCEGLNISTSADVTISYKFITQPFLATEHVLVFHCSQDVK